SPLPLSTPTVRLPVAAWLVRMIEPLPLRESTKTPALLLSQRFRAPLPVMVRSLRLAVQLDWGPYSSRITPSLISIKAPEAIATEPPPLQVIDMFAGPDFT